MNVKSLLFILHVKIEPPLGVGCLAHHLEEASYEGWGTICWKWSPPLNTEINNITPPTP